jgi:trafficking protein particle complex subunit 1
VNSCSFVSFRTGNYKLHYYETPTNLKFVMLTDTKQNNLRIVLHQIYVNLYVEFGRFDIGLIPRSPADSLLAVVKNPLSPVEHPGGIGVANELFELGLESFIVRIIWIETLRIHLLTPPAECGVIVFCLFYTKNGVRCLRR